MLKVYPGFVVSVVVHLSSACVPHVTPLAHATSARVLITQIQAGGVGVATKERHRDVAKLLQRRNWYLVK